MLRFDQITTNEQLNEQHIKEMLLHAQRSEEWRLNLEGGYLSSPLTAPDGAWDSELFICYNEFDQPVAILNPKFYRFGRLVTSLRPYIFPSHRKEGYGSELLKWAFKRYKAQGFNRIEAKVYGYNKGSLKLCRKFFTEEHALKEKVFIDGKFVDLHQFGILCRDINF